MSPSPEPLGLAVEEEGVDADPDPDTDPDTDTLFFFSTTFESRTTAGDRCGFFRFWRSTVTSAMESNIRMLTTEARGDALDLRRNLGGRVCIVASDCEKAGFPPSVSYFLIIY